MDETDISSDISDLKSVSDDITRNFTKFESVYNETIADIESLIAELEQEKSQVMRQIDHVANIDSIDKELLADFLEKPYTLVPKGENEAWVIVPRWIPFNVGYLQKQDESYNHFVVNKYINWISELPSDIQESVGIQEEFEEATVSDSTVEFSDEAERERAWDMLGGRDGGLYKREEDSKIKIKSGKEFDVIANLIENGNLPFAPNPIADSDLRSEPENVSLRSYQERAWEKFSETGMVGVYWPPGAGKTFLALYAGDRIRGEKLVVVPQKTLQEQWEDRISEFCEYPEEWDIKTYQYLTYGDNMNEYNEKEIAFTIFDESHTLPSKTHSKLSTLDTKYRMGLSASPYREDDRVQYIFALTGYPVGLNWDEFVELGVTEYPDVKVLLHRTEKQKVASVKELASAVGKTVIFCDDIAKGKQLASELGVEFIHGETEDRMEKFRENRVVVSSRVGDEGLSVSSLRRVIEFDFHGSSRRQELQRAGRVMHNDTEEETEHIVLMTDEESDKFGDRLLALEEKGFTINYIRQA